MKNETDKMRRLYDPSQSQSMSWQAFCNQNGLGYHKLNYWVKKIKGEREEKMKELALEKLIIFKPGLLLRKNTDRLCERISSTQTQFLNRLAIIKKFSPMPTSPLAKNGPKHQWSSQKEYMW